MMQVNDNTRGLYQAWSHVFEQEAATALDTATTETWSAYHSALQRTYNEALRGRRSTSSELRTLSQHSIKLLRPMLAESRKARPALRAVNLPNAAKPSKNPSRMLREALAADKLKPLSTPGGGNCLYHSVSKDLALVGEKQKHTKLRRLTADQMAIAGAPAKDVADHRRNGTWGENGQILSLAQALGRPILTYSCNPQHPVVCRQLYMPSEEDIELDKLLVIENEAGNHYNAVKILAEADRERMIEDAVPIYQWYGV